MSKGLPSQARPSKALSLGERTKLPFWARVMKRQIVVEGTKMKGNDYVESHEREFDHLYGPLNSYGLN